MSIVSFLLSQTNYSHAVIVLLRDIAKPLTPDQLTEIEKDPQSIVNKCVETLLYSKGHSDNLTSYENDQIGLCDNFMSHLQDKCRDFNNLLAYCELDVLASMRTREHSVAEYNLDRIAQLNCLENINYGSFCKEYISNFTASDPTSTSPRQPQNSTSHLQSLFQNSQKPHQGPTLTPYIECGDDIFLSKDFSEHDYLPEECKTIAIR